MTVNVGPRHRSTSHELGIYFLGGCQVLFVVLKKGSGATGMNKLQNDIFVDK